MVPGEWYRGSGRWTQSNILTMRQSEGELQSKQEETILRLTDRRTGNANGTEQKKHIETDQQIHRQANKRYIGQINTL